MFDECECGDYCPLCETCEFPACECICEETDEEEQEEKDEDLNW